MIVFRIHGMTLKERTRIKTSPTAVYIVNIIATAKKKHIILACFLKKNMKKSLLYLPFYHIIFNQNCRHS